MDEWIKKSDVVKAFEDVLDCDFFHVSEETPRERIEAIPSADRPRGEWRNIDGEPVPLDEGGCPTESAWCSECGTWLVASDEYSVIGRFCPNCGADMRGESEENRMENR